MQTTMTVMTTGNCIKPCAHALAKLPLARVSRVGVRRPCGGFRRKSHFAQTISLPAPARSRVTRHCMREQVRQERPTGVVTYDALTRRATLTNSSSANGAKSSYPYVAESRENERQPRDHKYCFRFARPTDRLM